jgi:hypothetical protein
MLEGILDFVGYAIIESFEVDGEWDSFVGKLLPKKGL